MGIDMDMEKYDEFEKKLKEKYPQMFSRPYGGIAVGEGWWMIIETLCENIHSHIKWRRGMRARDLRWNRALAKGQEAFTKFYCKGKEPNVWDLERIDDAIEAGPRPVTEKLDWIRIAQIKEKFGGLRFYYDGGNEKISGMVDMAECWAAHTCETCGERGTQRSGGWIRTLCDKHEEEYKKGRLHV